MLSGTAALSPARNTAFYDHYQRQYSQTLVWLQRALRTAALRRDQERSVDVAWVEEKRHLFAKHTGFDQIALTVQHTQITSLQNGARQYIVSTSLLEYTGLLWEPATAAPAGVIILDLLSAHDDMARIASYQAAGLRVIAPCFARSQRSFANDPARHWYFFNDDELLHLMFFLAGGSLVGLEAAELVTVASALGEHEGRRLPVALHLSDQHTLAMMSAAALGPYGHDPLFALVVLGAAAGQADHQEVDLRTNTIWGFHTHWDALTLLQMARRTSLLFAESAVTPSALYGRAKAWLGMEGQSQRHLQRLAAFEQSQLTEAIVEVLTGGQAGIPTPESLSAYFDADLWDGAHRHSLNSKLVYLEALHVRPRTQRQQRFAPGVCSADAYRQRIEESLARVVGPPLPETTDRSPHTRRILRRPAYDLYEVVLTSVPGVEVAGYLLLPTNELPAPAIICQHGLGGRPDALAGFDERFEGQWVYDQFARRLAEKGYVVFVPFMNWGWPATEMRDTLVKHAYTLGMTPNRFEVAQLHAIVDFLQGRPEVITDRIAFYGLSYGGHASLWLCAHEPRLAAVVTAGHFNDWQAKLTSLEISPPQERPTSYLTVDEGYDMFNYNVLNEIGHAELATRFAPRPCFIENGLRDAVTPTAWVEREFANVHAVFAWLDAAEQAELEHFPGPHRVWAEGSFRFLERHLRD